MLVLPCGVRTERAVRPSMTFVTSAFVENLRAQRKVYAVFQTRVTPFSGSHTHEWMATDIPRRRSIRAAQIGVRHPSEDKCVCSKARRKIYPSLWAAALNSLKVPGLPEKQAKHRRRIIIESAGGERWLEKSA